jgi:hypothetical protein
MIQLLAAAAALILHQVQLQDLVYMAAAVHLEVVVCQVIAYTAEEAGDLQLLDLQFLVVMEEFQQHLQERVQQVMHLEVAAAEITRWVGLQEDVVKFVYGFKRLLK